MESYNQNELLIKTTSKGNKLKTIHFLTCLTRTSREQTVITDFVGENVTGLQKGQVLCKKKHNKS